MTPDTLCSNLKFMLELGGDAELSLQRLSADEIYAIAEKIDKALSQKSGSAASTHFLARLQAYLQSPVAEFSMEVEQIRKSISQESARKIAAALKEIPLPESSNASWPTPSTIRVQAAPGTRLSAASQK